MLTTRAERRGKDRALPAGRTNVCCMRTFWCCTAVTISPQFAQSLSRILRKRRAPFFRPGGARQQPAAPILPCIPLAASGFARRDGQLGLGIYPVGVCTDVTCRQAARVPYRLNTPLGRFGIGEQGTGEIVKRDERIFVSQGFKPTEQRQLPLKFDAGPDLLQSLEF